MISPPLPGSGHSRHRADDREAPSTLLNGCRSIATVQTITGVLFLSLAATMPWLTYEGRFTTYAFMKLTGRPVAPDQLHSGNALVCGLCVLLALVLFRSAHGLRKFARQRLLSGLHPALARLRAAWRLLAIVQLILVLLVLAGLLVAVFASPPAPQNSL
jgi:hypothetical protein